MNGGEAEGRFVLVCIRKRGRGKKWSCQMSKGNYKGWRVMREPVKPSRKRRLRTGNADGSAKKLVSFLLCVCHSCNGTSPQRRRQAGNVRQREAESRNKPTSNHGTGPNFNRSSPSDMNLIKTADFN